MWSRAKIKRAIAEFPHEAADALSAIQLDPTARRIDPAALQAAAEQLNMKVERLWVEALENNRLLSSFAKALEARGLKLDTKPVAIDEDAVRIEDTNIDGEKLASFANIASSFGCRIRREGDVVGSGVLVGPTTVVTAWHVVAPARPDLPQEPWPKIEVILSDGRKVKAHVPAAYQSMCSLEEFANQFPKSDQSVAGLHDVAVLRLAHPVGALLGSARLPENPVEYRTRNSILLLHYPEGKEVGIGVGSILKVRSLTARWGHSIRTEGGSSGGGCFNSELALVGIHQGRDPRQRGRMVPTSYYLDDLRRIVANDEAPPRMWSLDETPNGEFVIGRQGFFEAFAAARRNARVRGIRVKRAMAAGDLSGLPFSYLMAERLTARRSDMRIVRLSFEALVPDVANEIARRASAAGIPVGTIEPAAGVADGQSAPEAVGADRGREAAIRIDRTAGLRGLQVWVFVDHPAIAFGDEQRSALEAFIDQSINLENIRLIIAGFEAVPLPGQEFYATPDPGSDGGRGLLTEILTGFQRSDVRAFLIDAATAAGIKLSDNRLDKMVDDALRDLSDEGGYYAPWIAGQVVERLREPVARLF
jgi:V8-like Glu-specific endopeptidase